MPGGDNVRLCSEWAIQQQRPGSNSCTRARTHAHTCTHARTHVTRMHAHAHARTRMRECTCACTCACKARSHARRKYVCMHNWRARAHTQTVSVDYSRARAPRAHATLTRHQAQSDPNFQPVTTSYRPFLGRAEAQEKGEGKGQQLLLPGWPMFQVRPHEEGCRV